jgi:hypothetical protein
VKIDSHEQLKRWNFVWPQAGDGPWELTVSGIDKALGHNRTAIGVYWIGYSPFGNHKSFQPKYCGKAVKQSLYFRLNQHVRKSSNQKIREHLAAGKSGMPKLWFRFVELPTLQLAELLEGLTIAAYSEEYWNARNEWVQHWAMEEDYQHR